VTLIERGPSIGTNIREWAHVTLFSNSALNISTRGVAVLNGMGLEVPRTEMPRILDGMPRV
jgi:hypothetical protein